MVVHLTDVKALIVSSHGRVAHRGLRCLVVTT
jgi:hypothetical protein